MNVIVKLKFKLTHAKAPVQHFVMPLALTPINLVSLFFNHKYPQLLMLNIEDIKNSNNSFF